MLSRCFEFYIVEFYFVMDFHTYVSNGHISIYYTHQLVIMQFYKY